MDWITRSLQRANSLSLPHSAKAAIERVPRWLGAEAHAARYNPPELESADAQTRIYTLASWVQIAVSVTAQTAAGADFSVKRRMGEDTKDIPNHPFEVMLHRPNPLMSRFELLEATVAYRQLTGNAYWWLSKPNEQAPPEEAWVIPSHRIIPVPDGKQFIRGYIYNTGLGDPIPLEPWEVCHFKRFNPNSPYVGLSALEALRMAVHGDLKTQEWQLNFYAQDNAKFGGVLAFAEGFNEGDWERMQAQVKSDAGGSKRRMYLMLHGVGKGGVEFIPTAQSIHELELYQGRQFTKEEIFSMLAPGLASVLAINATEANAVTGKNTLIDIAVWPILVSMAEKITNDVLPSYGGDLLGEFDDIRATDRELELREIDTYGKYHTVDETRERFWQDKPMAEVAGEQADDIQPPLVVDIEQGIITINDRRKQLGLEPVDDSKDLARRELMAQAELFNKWAEKLPPEVAAKIVGVKLPEMPKPEPPPMPPGQPPQQRATMPPKQAQQTDGEEEDDMDEQTAKAADLQRWQRKALKALRAGKSPAVAFDSEALTDAEAGAIREALRGAETPEAVKAAFMPGSATAPALPDKVQITKQDVDRGVAIWDELMPDMAGLLDAEVLGDDESESGNE